jgi:hypothetical protein
MSGCSQRPVGCAVVSRCFLSEGNATLAIGVGVEQAIESYWLDPSHAVRPPPGRGTGFDLGVSR